VGVQLINVAEDKVKGRAFVKTEMNFRVPLSKMKFLTDRQTIPLSRRYPLGAAV